MEKKLTITIDESVLNLGDLTLKLNEVYEKTTSGLDRDLLKAQTAILPKEEWKP
jgi:hypothetical protein